MKRRDFLKLSGCFVATASASNLLSACGDDDGGGLPEGTFAFDQGVASGDPRESSVMLWTRVSATDGSAEPVSLVAEVSTTEGFDELVVSQEIEATDASDFCVRLLVTGLDAGTIYFYRFRAGSDEIVGRTITAPAIDDDSPVRLAWVSCQDYGAGTYGAYRQMLVDDEALAADEQIQVVVHLGDFIYETIGGRFQVPLDDEFEPIELIEANGQLRAIDDFPSGGGQDGEARFARSLADYRHLYKQYLRDPHLKAARARWPFIHTWDDHEFTDDCWQSQANYTSNNSTNEPSQSRKVAANQAWFEYMPVNLSDAEGVPGVPNEASDFVATEVEDVAFSDVNEDNIADEENNIKAIESLTIYRSIRYGKNVDFVVTDERSYKSDHSIPEELSADNGIFFHPRTALPAEAVLVMDQGRTANGGNPPDNVQGLNNVRKDSPPGTMLGTAQKAWWKETMSKSDATWKLWCNEVPMMRFSVPVGPAGILIFDRVAFCDAWDDKPTERNELMTYLRDEDIDNVVVITGDMHAHFAGTLMHNYDVETPEPVAAEFVAAGISSNTVFSFFEDATRGQPPQLRDLVTYDSTELGGDTKFVNNLNNLLFNGSAAAIEAASSNDLDAIEAAADRTINPHLKFVDCDAQGYGLMTVTSDDVVTKLITINRPVADMGEAGQGIKTTATFTLDVNSRGAISEPVVEGDKPFPMR